MRDVLLLLRARARAWSFRSLTSFVTSPRRNRQYRRYSTAHQTNTFDCTIKYFAIIIAKTNRANLILIKIQHSCIT